MADRDSALMKGWATGIARIVAPDDAFVIEDGFDGIARHWHEATAQEEGRFIGGADISPFVALLVPFLVGVFADVTKDVAKEGAKKLLGSLMDKLLRRQASHTELSQFRAEVQAALLRSRFSDQQRRTLADGFDDLLVEVSTPG